LEHPDCALPATPLQGCFTHLDCLFDGYSELRLMPPTDLASPRSQGSLDAKSEPWKQPQTTGEHNCQKVERMFDPVFYKLPLAFA
jgi:hypothetical protein